MKNLVRENLEKNQNELQKFINDEGINMRKLGIAVSLGREKKTHLLKLSRRKVAVFKTLLSQKKFLKDFTK